MNEEIKETIQGCGCIGCGCLMSLIFIAIYVLGIIGLLKLILYIWNL